MNIKFNNTLTLSKKSANMFCAQCGNLNDVSAKFCSGCGSGLTQNGQARIAMQFSNKASDTQDEFYKALIGRKNQTYYMDHFRRFDNVGNAGITWHWPAFFVTFYWLLYRKMWSDATVYFFLPYLIILPVAIVGELFGKLDNNLLGGLFIFIYLGALFVLYPLYANALYYKHCRKKINKVKVSSDNLQRQLSELASIGGISYSPLVLIFLMVGVMLAAIAIPAYQDYIIRARLAEAVSIGNAAAEKVANYIYQHQEIPISLEHAGFEFKSPSSVKEITFDSEIGAINITIGIPPIQGKTLVFDPSLNENNNIIWSCISQDIPERYLPRECSPSQ